ncbi:MAG: MFS transporter [Planctomycetota bacterium]|nr:MFS transporter [Planctomycetota bacterium]
MGATFFTAVQGTVFNFYIEDLGLNDRLGFFMGLASLAGIGAVLGSWFQGRYGYRKALFVWTVGGSRLIWLVIGLIPILWPDLNGDRAFLPLAALVVLFFITHAMGSNAWLSWMADLVPPEIQGKYWGMRQVGCSAAGAIARFGFGYFLDLHHNPAGYLAIYAFCVVVGVADALLFLGVEHREAKLTPKNVNILREFVTSLKDAGLRRMIGVYLLWSVSNCVMGAAVFRFLRRHVEMGVFPISVIEMITLASFTAFSFLWGHFSDRHGHRGPLVLCLLIHGLCPIPYFFAGPGDWHLAGLGFVAGSLGFCGINLFMWPMLISYTTRKGAGRAMGMAAFALLLGIPGFFVFWLSDDVLRPVFQWATGAASIDSRPVYMALFVLAMALRFSSMLLAWRLPVRREETAPGLVISMFATTNPLRATVSLVRYVTIGFRDGEEGPFTVQAARQEHPGAGPRRS